MIEWRVSALLLRFRDVQQGAHRTQVKLAVYRVGELARRVLMHGPRSGKTAARCAQPLPLPLADARGERVELRVRWAPHRLIRKAALVDHPSPNYFTSGLAIKSPGEAKL